MANIFTLENFEDFSEKLNIDDLYEKKRQHDLSKLELFNKILNRIHVKIKTTSRQKMDEQFCWYVVPEIILGVPKYDQGACIAYLMDKLLNNGFAVRYIHPNALFICWQQWVPSYVRTELKKKTGIVVNEFGKKVDSGDGKDSNGINPFQLETGDNMSNPMFSKKINATQSENLAKKEEKNKKYTPIQKYKPFGNLVYDDEIINLLEGGTPP
jgi:hypothetical protein